MKQEVYVEKCPVCDTKIPDKGKFCLNCGEPILRRWADSELASKSGFGRRRLNQTGKAGMPGKTKILLSVCIVIPLMLVIGVGSMLFSEVSKKDKDKMIVEIRHSLSKLPKSDYGNRAALYKQLVTLEPENKKFRDMVAYLEKKARQEQSADKDVTFVAGFDSFQYEVSKAQQEFGCKSYRRSQGSVFNCPYARNPNVVWSVRGEGADGKAKSSRLSWSSLTNSAGQMASLSDDTDAKYALSRFANRHAPGNFRSLESAFDSRRSVKILSRDFVLNYSTKKSGKKIERALEVKSRKE
ncbi:MAG: zinc ribbon domain-containing protein [Alphaproteobacteria bacterium]|nr:zinc ribbon domain-containing protein [Alphaproteobacteria bacterium]